MDIQNHTQINSESFIGTVKPLDKNKEKIALFLLKKHKELEELFEMECGTGYMVFVKPKDNVIGGIFMSKEQCELRYLAHECSHATYDYMKIVNPKFRLGKIYKNLSKTSINEERFCVVIGQMIQATMDLYKNNIKTS
jgi:sulfatase maturation enzyme AslB (radical SAM superfamily)